MAHDPAAKHRVAVLAVAVVIVMDEQPPCTLAPACRNRPTSSVSYSGPIGIEAAGTAIDVFPVDPEDVSRVGEQTQHGRLAGCSFSSKRFAKHGIDLFARRRRGRPDERVLQCKGRKAGSPRNSEPGASTRTATAQKAGSCLIASTNMGNTGCGLWNRIF